MRKVQSPATSWWKQKPCHTKGVLFQVQMRQSTLKASRAHQKIYNIHDLGTFYEGPAGNSDLNFTYIRSFMKCQWRGKLG